MALLCKCSWAGFPACLGGSVRLGFECEEANGLWVDLNSQSRTLWTVQ